MVSISFIVKATHCYKTKNKTLRTFITADVTLGVTLGVTVDVTAAVTTNSLFTYF